MARACILKPFARPQTPPFGRPEVGSTVFVLRSTHKLHSIAAVEDAFGQGAVPDAPVGFCVRCSLLKNGRGLLLRKSTALWLADRSVWALPG
jgi:hypothetical protein